MIYKLKLFIFLAVFYCLPQVEAYAAIYDTNLKKLPDDQLTSPLVNWRDFTKNNSQGISGIGIIGSYGLDICTSSLIDTGNKAGPAYLLTNAHCDYFDMHWYTDLGATETRVNQYTAYYVTFNHYRQTPASLRKEYPLKQIAYITENGTDVAIFEMQATLGEMIADGIKPLKLSTQAPQLGLPVQLIGAPLLPWYPEYIKSLHISDCTLLYSAKLKNGDHFAPESIAHQCDSIPGFSVGPLIKKDTQEIVLLNSHGADDADADKADCSYETRPCEWSPSAPPIVRPEFSYGQRVDTIAGCFDSSGHFNLALAACGLPKPTENF